MAATLSDRRTSSDGLTNDSVAIARAASGSGTGFLDVADDVDLHGGEAFDDLPGPLERELRGRQVEGQPAAGRAARILLGELVLDDPRVRARQGNPVPERAVDAPQQLGLLHPERGVRAGGLRVEGTGVETEQRGEPDPRGFPGRRPQEAR